MGKRLICVVGPTAIGKTALAIKLARHYDTEILSADSRQFYKEMTIGTAVPSSEELKAAKHHFIQHISIHHPYSVGQFERDALKLLKTLFKKRDTVILVGGSGLYVKAVTEGLDEFPTIDEGIRADLLRELDHHGIERLQSKLEKLDAERHAAIDLQNTQRVIRSLEVCIASGKPYSSFLAKKKEKRDFEVVKIGLTADRALIYNRINTRVDAMLAAGLVQEARLLYPHSDLNALNTVGYKELFSHFDGGITRQTAIEEIKKNTRRFAKRQLTWSRKDGAVQWYAHDDSSAQILEALK